MKRQNTKIKRKKVQAEKKAYKMKKSQKDRFMIWLFGVKRKKEEEEEAKKASKKCLHSSYFLEFAKFRCTFGPPCTNKK